MVVKFKAITPKNANIAAALGKLVDAMNDSGEDPLRDLNATVQSWEGAKPSFKKTLSVGASSITLRIEAVGSAEGLQKWSWIDKGTRPHLIVPKKAGGVLRFQTGYNAKTRPNSFESSSGGKYGEQVAARAVRHPGTAPRGWSEMLVEKYRPKFWDAVREGMKRAARASGHGR